MAKKFLKEDLIWGIGYDVEIEKIKRLSLKRQNQIEDELKKNGLPCFEWVSISDYGYLSMSFGKCLTQNQQEQFLEMLNKIYSKKIN